MLLIGAGISHDIAKATPPIMITVTKRKTKVEKNFIKSSLALSSKYNLFKYSTNRNNQYFI